MFNKLTLFTLITIVTIILATVFVNLRAPQTEKEKPLFFPELKDNIDQVAKISIQSFDDTLNLSKQGNKWLVDEYDGYPALTDKVNNAVLELADLKLNSPKTALERLYPRLGVEGPITAESTSKLLTINNVQNETMVNMIVGNPRRSSTAKNRPGLYVRKQDDQQSYLVDGRLELSAKLKNWIERSLLDIPAEDIQRVTIRHDDGEQFSLFKTVKGEDTFQLENLPDDKKLAPEIVINRFGAILSDIQISSVMKNKSLENISDKVNTSIMTFDGLEVDMQAFTYEGRPYASFVFSVNAENNSADAIVKSKLEQYASNMNSKLQGWLFEIQGFKFDILKNRLDQITRDDN